MRLLLLALLLISPLAAQSKSVKLRGLTLKSAAELPIALRYVVVDRLPEQLVGKGYAATARRGKLEVDTTGDGRRDKTTSGTRPIVLKIGKKPVRPILVFKLFETWFAGPAACLVGVFERRVVTLLDANLDGRFDGPEDYIRFGHGSFHRQNPIRLLAEDDLLLRYEFDAEKPAIRVTPIAKPARYNPLQWRALQAANHFRSHAGLSPLELNPKRCDGCQKHAWYLLVNNYDFFKPQEDGHDEKPGNPEYTKEGQEAARTHGVGGTGDAARSILGQTQTILHRTVFMGSVSAGLGVGAVAESHNNSAQGYSVVGGDDPRVSDERGIVVVPAPGQRRVEQYCSPELPYPDRDPTFYQTTRGFPISVSYGNLPITESLIELFIRKRTALQQIPGSLFSLEKPVSRTLPENAQSTIFVPRTRLHRKTTYVVRFRAKNGGTPIELAWEFTVR